MEGHTLTAAGRARAHGRGAKADDALVAQRLLQASDAQLQQLAQYRRPKWQTLTLRALAVDDDDEMEDDDDGNASEGDGDGGGDEEDGEAEKEEKEEAADTVEVETEEKTKEKGSAVEVATDKPRRRRGPVVVAQQPLEMLEGASLADVRKLISTFCAAKIPSRFVFAALHRQRQEGLIDEDVDERDVVVEDALDEDGALVVLIPSLTSRTFTRGGALSPTRTSASTVSGFSSRLHLAPNVLPAFSAARIVFGDVSAAVNVFIRRNDGVTLELSGFCDRNGAKIEGLSTAELTMQLVPKVLAQRVGMTESMVSILVSSPPGQSKIVKKLFSKLHLSVVEAAESGGDKELRWRWTAHNVVRDTDLHVNRRTRAAPQVDEPATRATEFSQEGKDDTESSEPPPSDSQEDVQSPDLSAIDGKEQLMPNDSISLPTIADSATQPVVVPGVKSLVKKIDEAKAQPCEEVRSMPVGTPPEKKKPEQLQTTKPLIRKSSVDVNAAQLRICLEIGAMQIGEDIPSCFSLQMIFIELMLRDFASSSLPVFVSEVRPALKEVYRSMSQTSTPEIVVKSIDLLWAGLSIAFWESKIDQIVAHFHKVATAVVSDLRSKLVKSSFDVLEASPLPVLPRHVDAMLRALSILAGEQHVGEKSIETVIKDLGLNNTTNKRRLKSFKAFLKKKTGNQAISSSLLILLSTYAEAADLTRPMAPEDQCHLSSLRSLLMAVLDTINFDLRTYARRYVAAGENATTLRSAVWSLVTRKDRGGNLFVSESTKNVEALTAVFSTWATERALAPEQMKRLGYLLQQQSADPVRWYKAHRDCEVLASCPVPPRPRWYIEPKARWCEDRAERYILVGEADFVFEFVYLVRDDPTPPDQSALVKRALSAWFDSATTSESGNSTGAPDHVKIGFGVNYRYAGHPLVIAESISEFKRILGNSPIDSIVVGSSHGPPGCSNVVMLRLYVQESFSQQHSWSASTFLHHVLQENETQKKMVENGALPLLRMLALREQRKREPVVTLDESIQSSESQAHMALRAALRVAGCHEPLVLSASVSHLVLDLVIRRRIGIEYGSDYLRGLNSFVQEAATDHVCEFLNQRFERFEDSRVLDPEADVYDILWLLASAQGGFAEEWRELAEEIVTRVFLLPGVLNDRRIFKYSTQVRGHLFHLARDDAGELAAVTFDSSNSNILGYFERIPEVVQAAIQASATMTAAPSRFSVAVTRTSPETVTSIHEQLLERFFAVLRTEAGLLSLFMRKEVVNLLDDILQERGHSARMALLAVELASRVAGICQRNEEVERMVYDLRLVEHLVGAAWRVKSEVIGGKLMDALLTFQCLASFRKQVVLSLPRLSARPVSCSEDSLLRQILPSGSSIRERDEYTWQVRRFNSRVRWQFFTAHKCSCGGRKTKRHSVAMEAEREVVSQIATTFATAIIDRAITLVVAGRLHEERVSASQRLLSAAIKFRKAAKIQHRVLRWLYASKRLPARQHTMTEGTRSCGVCKRKSSFVDGVVRYFDGVVVTEPTRPTQILDETMKALQCFQIFVSDHGLCQVLVSEFRLQRTLLVLISSKYQPIRHLALQLLAELCWRSPIAFDFTRSRLMKPIWENVAVLLKKNESRYCSWIERTIHTAVNKTRVTSSQPVSTTMESRVQHRGVKQINNCEPDPDVGPAASMMMVLSYGSEDFDLMLRVVRLTSGSISQWIHESAPYTHVKMLLIIQNTLILAPSLSALSDMALKCVQDFRHMMNAGYVNDYIAKTLIFGSMWTMCTDGHIRKQVAIQYSDVLGDVFKWMESTISASRVLDLSVLPILLSGAGLAATVSVDFAVKSVALESISISHQLYSSLEAVPLDSADELVGIDGEIAGVDGADPSHPFCHVQSDWAKQLARFKLLPELGSFRCLSTKEQLANAVKDQLFRFYAIVASSQTYDDATSSAALQCYVDTLDCQVRRGGCSADFSLKTLPHVFRCATTTTTVGLVTKKPAMTDQQAATIVNVLGAAIQTNADRRKSESQGTNDFSATKTVRLVIMALWGLQVASGKAQSLSHSLANELVDLLRLSKDDTKLRIAILGLLVKMYRVHAHSGSEVLAGASSVSDRNQVRVLRVVMSEVPTIMELLRPHSMSDDGSTILHRMKRWSPLLLDKGNDPGTAQHEHKMEVVRSVRWPVEVMNLLCESIFIEKISVTQDYYDVLLSILLQLDKKSMRSSDIQGRDEVLLAIARILRVFCQRLPLTPAQADRCIHALFESDSMMTYASDLAVICHRTVELSRSIDALICRPERNVLVASLCFISSGKLRLDVLSKCLDMVSAFIKAFGEGSCMKQLMLYEHNHGSASAALFKNVLSIFQGVITEEIEWAVCRKGLKLFQDLIIWDSFLSRIVRCKKTNEVEDSKRVRSLPLESVSYQRSRTHVLDETTKGMVRMALLLVHFKYWLGDVTSSFYDEVLQASAHAGQIIVRILHDFHENSSDSTIFLGQVTDALINNNQHKLLPATAMKESMEALVYIFCTTFKDAKNSLHSSFLSRDTCEVIYISALTGLVSISMHHRARHSVQMTLFFIQNYRSPIFDEPRPEILAKLVRLYRRCCCNAFVYRLIRLGKTSMWNVDCDPDDDNDQSFYRRLGTSFATFGSPSDSKNQSRDYIRFDIALFLAQQHFPIETLPRSTENTNGVSVSEDAEVLKPADEKALRMCLRDQFAAPMATTTISYSAKEFEAGVIGDELGVGCDLSSVLVNELVEVIRRDFTHRNELALLSIRRTAGDEDSLALLAIIDQLASAAGGTCDGVVFNRESWCKLLQIVKTCELHVSELRPLLNILSCHATSAASSSSTPDIADVLSARIGSTGIRSFGLTSCEAAMAFASSWIVTLAEEDVSQVLTTPRYLDGIFDILLLCVVKPDDYDTHLCQDAFDSLLSMAKIASAANIRVIVEKMDQWKAKDPSSISTSRAACETSWQVLIQLTFRRSAVDQVDWKQAVFHLMRRLFDENSLIFERLSAHNFCPLLCQQLFEHDRAVVRSALDLLHAMCCASTSVRLSLGCLVRSDVTRPYQNGMLIPLRAESWNQSGDLSPDACRAQRDQGKIIDILVRQAICATLTSDEIVNMSLMLQPYRFAGGEAIIVSASSPALLIVASGAVDWTLTVRRVNSPCSKAITSETSRVGKGGVIGATTLLTVRHCHRFEVSEAAKAANDVVCLVATDQVWQMSPLSHKIRVGVARVTGAWHRWMKGDDSTDDSSGCYAQQLVRLATGEMGSDPDNQNRAADLLRQICSSVVSPHPDDRDLDLRDSWFVCLVVPIIQHKEVSPALRRDICRLIADLAAHPLWSYVLMSLSRDDRRRDGLVVLGRAFRQCAIDPDSIDYWLRAVVQLSSQEPVDAGSSPSSVVVRAMTDGDLLKLTGLCLASPTIDDTTSDHKGLDPWDVFLLACHFQRRLCRLMKALDSPERLELARRIVLMLRRNHQAASLSLRILAKATKSADFCSALWSANEVSSEDSDITPDFLYLAKQMITDGTCAGPTIDHIVEIMSNSLKMASVLDETKQRIIRWIRQVFGADLSPLQCLRAQPPVLCATEQYSLASQVCSLVRTIDWCCTHLKTNGPRVMARELRQSFGEVEWLAVVEKHFVAIVQAACSSRTHLVTALTAMRILCDSRAAAPRDDLEHVGDVLTKLQNGGRDENSKYPRQSQCDPVLQSYWRGIIPQILERTTDVSWLPLDISSSRRCFEANYESLGFVRQTQSSQAELVRRLQLFREISASKHSAENDGGECLDDSENGLIVSWLVDMIVARDSSAQAVRVAIGCLQNLLRTDDRIMRYVATNAEERVLPRCFAAFGESSRARVSTVRLLQQICSLVDHSVENDSAKLAQASEWMRSLTRVLLQQSFEVEMIRSFVEILRWLLSRYAEGCFLTNEESSVAEELFKYLQTSLISSPPEQGPDPAASIDAALHGVSIVAQILAVKTVRLQDASVVSTFADAAVSWAAFVIRLAECGFPTSTAQDNLFFGCLSAICQVSADDRYPFHLKDMPGTQIESLLKSSFRVMAVLPKFRIEERRTVLQIVRIVFEALHGDCRRAAQAELESISNHNSGWISSLASGDVEELCRATMVMELMCERNDDVISVYATGRSPILRQLVANLRRCNELLRESIDSSLSPLGSQVLQLLTCTSAILRRLVRVLALVHQPIERPLLEEVETSLSRLPASVASNGGCRAQVEAMKASIWLLKSCIKHHVGFCRRQLSKQWASVLTTVSRVLLVLKDEELDQCADVLVWVTRLQRPTQPSPITNSRRQDVSDLLSHLLGRIHRCQSGSARSLPRLFRAMHAVMASTQSILEESANDVISARQLPGKIVDSLASIYPHFSVQVEAQTVVDCCALALDLDGDHTLPQRLEATVIHTVESARRGFLNSLGSDGAITEDAVVRARQVQRLSSLTKILCASLSLWGLLITRAKSQDFVGEGRVLWVSVLAGLAACSQAKLTRLIGHIANEAARLMQCSCSNVSAFPGEIDADDSVTRISELLQAGPTWQLAWLLTSVSRGMHGRSRGSLPTQLQETIPSLISAMKTHIDQNQVHSSFYLLGLIVEVLRDFASENEAQPETNQFPAWGNQLYEVLESALQTRPSVEFGTLTLLCWFLLARLEIADHASCTSALVPSTVFTNGSAPEVVPRNSELFVQRAATLVRFQVGQFCQNHLVEQVLSAAALKRIYAEHRRDIGAFTATALTTDIPAITLLDFPAETKRVICVYFTLKILEDAIRDDSSRSTIGRLFAEQTTLISDVAHLLDRSESLPTAYAEIVLHLLAGATKTFRLFVTPVVNEVKLSSISRLVLHPETSISLGAMCTLWQLLRNRRLCHRFVALVKPAAASASATGSDDPVSLHRAIQHVKEHVFTVELDARRLEAAYGILVQMTKAEESLDVVVVMDELHAQAIFMDDPDNLLAAVGPSTHSGVLLQQCKLLKHLSRWRPHSVLSKPAALQCLGDAIVTVEAHSSGSEARWFLAVGAALVSLVGLAGGASVTSAENLRLLFEDRRFAVLNGCHQALSWTVRSLYRLDEPVGSTHARLHRVLSIYASLFFSLTSSKRKLCLLSGIVSDVSGLPRTILQALDVNRALQESLNRGFVDHQQRAHFNCDLVHAQLLRTLRRLTLTASVAAEFRSQDVVNGGEPFDLLMSLLNHTHSARRDSHTREMFLVILHISRDDVVSANIASRHDVLTGLFQFHSRYAPVTILDLFWQVLHNVLAHATNVGDILQRLSSSEHVVLLAQHVRWGEAHTQLSSLALAMTSSLRVVAEKSSVHRLLLLFVPVFHDLVFQSPWDSASAVESLILENVMVTLALTAHVCVNDFVLFETVLFLVEKLITICTVEFSGTRSIGSPPMRYGSVTQPLGLPTAVERLVCALCDLLLSFHEDEVNNSFFPGYEIKPVRNTSHGPSSPTPSNASHDRKRSARASDARVTTRASLSVRSKSNGVFSKGYSPANADIVECILRIFTSACTLPVTRARVERLRLRSGRSIGGASAGSSILYVSDFFFHAAKTPSGRFFFLNPLVIQFWKPLLPRMDPHSLRKLCDGLVLCTHSKDHVFKFLASGALRLLITATCTTIRSSTKKQHSASHGPATKPLPVVADAFLQLIVAAAVLTERAPFLQSTYYLVHAGATDSISLAGFVLAAIIHSSTGSPFLKLACKVLSRFLSLFTLEEAADFLTSCPSQIARALGWDFVTDDDVVMALVTMLQHTENEALMKHRVLVEVVHSTLLRTAILGLIDKGIPEVLHDYGLKTMMLHMEKLVAACDGLYSTSKEVPASPSDLNTRVEAMNTLSAPVRRNSITGTTKTSVEKLAAGFTAVGDVARNAGTLFATTFQDGDDQAKSTDPRSRFTRRLERCVDALREITNEIAEYTETGYPTVFKSFELMNGDLELIAAMQSSSHAVALTQAAFYAMEILQEALTAALLDADEEDNPPQGGGRTTSGMLAGQTGDHRIFSKVSSGSSSTGSSGRSSVSADASIVLQTAEKLLGWITMSLQHSDMDVLFYGSKLIQLGSYADGLMRLPLDDYEVDHDTGHHDGNGATHGSVPDPESRTDSRRTRDQQPTLAPRRRIQRTENYPVFLRFRSLELRSWLWSVLGFLPYLRVRHNGNVQIIRFSKATAASESTDDSLQRLRGAFREYLCRFEVREAPVDHIQTFFRDLPHTVDVEVWVYLPFWPRDVLVSRAKVPLLARTIENDGYNFHLYPDSVRGVRANQAEIIGTLQMDLSNQRSEAAERPDNDNEFPAYSTLGSRLVRRVLRRIWSRVFAWTSDAVSTVAEVTQVNRLVEAATNASVRRKGLSVLATQDLNDSLERQDDSVTMEESVAYFLTKILRLLRELTHPDKLVAPGAVKATKPLVDELERVLPAFSQTLARAFKTKHTRVWRDAVSAADVVQGLFLTKGLSFFTTSFNQAKDPDKSPAVRKSSQREPRVSMFHAPTMADGRVQRRPLRDIASQLRRSHLHLDNCIRRIDDDHDALRLSSQSTFGPRLFGRSFGRAPPSAKLLSSMKSRNSQLSDGRQDGDVPTLASAAEYIHQYAASKAELRMLSSHISIWSLGQARVPEWHSFDRASGPTALNHFLLQPVERLQVYCAVQRFLEQKLKTMQRQDPSTVQAPAPALPSAESTRVRSASSMVSKFNSQRKGERKALQKESDDKSLSTTPSTPLKEAVERGPSFSHAVVEPKRWEMLGTLWKQTLSLSGHANRLAIVQKALNRAPDVTDFELLETIRARRLLKYHVMDPFDAASRLQRLYQDAKRLPSILYREGFVASVVHFGMWALLTVSVWRVSIARDAMRDSERSFQELHSSQSSGDNDQIHEVLMRPAAAKTGSADVATRDHTPRIVISNRQESQDSFTAPVKQICRHQVAPGDSAAPVLKPVKKVHKDCIVLTQQELKHLVVLLELRSLISDVFRVWPSENGNIGLNGFWSSLWFTGTALGSPFVFVYLIFPWVIQLNKDYTRYLSYVACAYGTAWIVAAYVSIRGVTKKIPAFREVRRVEKINLTSLPYCVRNYMAIGSVVWEGFQLNTTSFSVWKMSYKPKQLAALTTIDLQDIGLGSLQVNVFESKQTLALVSLLVWFFCLKASNKFKSLQYLNYSLTFLLPNFLGGMMFMFLSKQFYQSAACFENAQNVTVMWANSDIACWTDPAHATYALRGMFGMSIFVPLAVLAYGSYQVFFPEVNLDVQTSPLLNVSSQIVKAAMMGALTFFVDEVQLFLAVALVGNLLLLFLVWKYDLCSTWHLKYGKVLIYAMSSWAAFCAMVSTFVREGEDKDRVPLYIMHIGWGTLALLCLLKVRRRIKKNRQEAASGRQVLSKQQKAKPSWRRKAPSSVTPAGCEQETVVKADESHVTLTRHSYDADSPVDT